MSLFGIPLRPSSSLISNVQCTKRATRKGVHMEFQQLGSHIRSESSISQGPRGNYSRQSGRVLAETVETVFISALVAASSCRKHVPLQCGDLKSDRRRISSHTFRDRLPRPRKVSGVDSSDAYNITQEQAKELVNIYDSPKYLLNHPLRRQKLAPRLFMTPEQEERALNAPRDVLPPMNEQHSKQLARFEEKLRRGRPGWLGHHKFWQMWENLPAPRVRYLPDSTLRRLFAHLTTVEFKNTPGAMRRYMEVLEECLDERVPVTLGEWNSAVAFAGRWVREITTTEVKSAVEMWMRMEDQGVRASNVTFNILFDISVKAGRYALADTIYAELKARDMELSRFFRTSMIYYAGVRGDGDAVRNAFNEFVEAGEIVDTSVMNCVLLSLVRCGEGPSCEHVFARMKHLHETKLGTQGPNAWQHQRELGRILNATARRLRDDKRRHQESFFGGAFSQEDKREEIQKASPIAPNERTFRILINHHVRNTGNLSRVQELLTEMQQRGFRVHGSLYVSILRGFEMHGGYDLSEWSGALLEAVWTEFLNAVRKNQTLDRRYGSSDTVEPSLSAKNLNAIDEQDSESHSKRVFKDAYELDEEFMSHFSSTRTSESEEESQSSEAARDQQNDSDVNSYSSEASEDDVSQEAEDMYESEEARPLLFTRAVAKAALRSFYKCVGGRRMRQVWHQIQAQWQDMSGEDRVDLQRSVDWMNARS